MRFRIAAVLMLVGVVSLCGRAQVRPGGGSMLEVPFHRGVNLTGWLQAGSARQIQFTKFTKQDFVNIKSLGCDVIRLPINLHFMTDGDPRLHGRSAVLLFPGSDRRLVRGAGTAPDPRQSHVRRGRQHRRRISTRSWCRSGRRWPSTTRTARRISTTRSSTSRTGSPTPGGARSSSRSSTPFAPWIRRTRSSSPGPAGAATTTSSPCPSTRDDNLIYSFHFYDPFMFTHQGASWTDPSMVPLAGVPFPYGAGSDARVPAGAEGDLDREQPELVPERRHGKPRQAADRHRGRVSATSGRSPCSAASSACTGATATTTSGSTGIEVVRKYLEEKGIAWTIWDYQGGFGLFEKGTNELFEHDLNVPLVEALGLTAARADAVRPDAGARGFRPLHGLHRRERAGFQLPGPRDAGLLLRHRPGRRGRTASTAPGSTATAPSDSISGRTRISRCSCRTGCLLDFWVRGDTPGARFDVRFVDTKTTDPQDHPWRMGATIDQKYGRVGRPMASRADSAPEFRGPRLVGRRPGSIRRGLFDWSAVDRFEIVSEYHDFVGHAVLVHFHRTYAALLRRRALATARGSLR